MGYTQLRDNSNRLINLSISTVSFVIFSWFIKEFSNILIPVALGIILGLIFTPLLFALRKKKVPHIFSLIIVLIIFLALSLIFISIMTSSLYSMGNNFAKYQTQGVKIINSLAQLIPFLNPEVMVDMQKSLFAYLQSNIVSYSRTFLNSFIQISTSYLIAVFTMIFVLIERTYFHVKLLKYFDSNVKASSQISKMILNMNIQVSRFLLLKTIISAITAFIIYIGFQLIGVDFPFIWAILTFLFNFIPTVGSIIITLISMSFAILQFYPDYTSIILVFLLTGSTQMLVGNFLDPKIMGDSLNLSPLVIWFSLLYWGWVWGTMGALLAVPLTVIIRIVCEYTPSLQSLGLFMGNAKLMLRDHVESLKKGFEEQKNAEASQLDSNNDNTKNNESSISGFSIDINYPPKNNL